MDGVSAINGKNVPRHQARLVAEKVDDGCRYILWNAEPPNRDSREQLLLLAGPAQRGFSQLGPDECRSNSVNPDSKRCPFQSKYSGEVTPGRFARAVGCTIFDGDRSRLGTHIDDSPGYVLAGPEPGQGLLNEEGPGSDLTDGLGADVTMEAAGFPSACKLAADLVRSGGRIANIGVHEEPATLHIEKLWAKQVTITTGIPSALTVPALMKAIAAGTLDATTLISHRLPLNETAQGYEIFKNAAETSALKLVMHA